MVEIVQELRRDVIPTKALSVREPAHLRSVSVCLYVCL